VKTARAFESLCRIAEAHAKLMMREKTVLLDYVTAIALTENNYFSTIEEYYAILDNFNKKYSLSLS
jgi:DNA replicative helicase MCM subunit Mcm2 (Cdc46/Mcm family)